MLLLSRYTHMEEKKDPLSNVKALVSPAPTAEEPVIEPKGAQILSINGTVFSRGGRNSVSFRAPGNAIFNSPDGALVLTDLRQAAFDQFLVGQVYAIVISTTP